MNYIPAEKLKAKIEKRQEELSDRNFHSMADEYDTVLDIINSLQQEQPKVDLDFQVFAKEMDAVFNLPEEVTKNTEENPLNWEYAIARHFYELGQRNA